MKLHKTRKDPELYYYFNKEDVKMWCYRHRYYDETGKRREKKKIGFQTEKQAYRALLELKVLTSKESKKRVTNEEMTVSQWFETWLKTNKSTWRPNTYIQRKNLYDVHIKPLLGHYKLQKLDKLTYKRQYIDTFIKNKYSIKTIKLYHTVFKIAINSAVDNEILERNRFTKVKISDPNNHDIEMARTNYLTIEELDRLLKTTKEHANITTYTLFLLLAYTGLRRGEALGLQWNDIDFENKTLTVSRTRSLSGITPPKTRNSYRTIIIDDLLVKQLKTYKTWCKSTMLKYGKRLKEDGFILMSHNTGEKLSDSTVRNELTRLKKIAKVNDISPHGFRHTHATILINQGVNVKVIAERLGNTPAMIFDVYGHTFKEMEQGSVDMFGQAMGSIGAKTGAN